MTTKLLPVHPGEILLEDFIKPLGITPFRVARDMDIAPLRISQIVRGRRAVTADSAQRLARYFGTSAGIWMQLQARYDLEVAESKLAPRIAREVKALNLQTA